MNQEQLGIAKQAFALLDELNIGKLLKDEAASDDDLSRDAANLLSELRNVDQAVQAQVRTYLANYSDDQHYNAFLQINDELSAFMNGKELSGADASLNEVLPKSGLGEVSLFIRNFRAQVEAENLSDEDFASFKQSVLGFSKEARAQIALALDYNPSEKMKAIRERIQQDLELQEALKLAKTPEKSVKDRLLHSINRGFGAAGRFLWNVVPGTETLNQLRKNLLEKRTETTASAGEAGSDVNETLPIFEDRLKNAFSRLAEVRKGLGINIPIRKIGEFPDQNESAPLSNTEYLVRELLAGISSVDQLTRELDALSKKDSLTPEDLTRREEIVTQIKESLDEIEAQLLGLEGKTEGGQSRVQEAWKNRPDFLLSREGRKKRERARKADALNASKEKLRRLSEALNNLQDLKTEIIDEADSESKEFQLVYVDICIERATRELNQTEALVTMRTADIALDEANEELARLRAEVNTLTARLASETNPDKVKALRGQISELQNEISIQEATIRGVEKAISIFEQELGYNPLETKRQVLKKESRSGFGKEGRWVLKGLMDYAKSNGDQAAIFVLQALISSSPLGLAGTMAFGVAREGARSFRGSSQEGYALLADQQQKLLEAVAQATEPQNQEEDTAFRKKAKQLVKFIGQVGKFTSLPFMFIDRKMMQATEGGTENRMVQYSDVFTAFANEVKNNSSGLREANTDAETVKQKLAQFFADQVTGEMVGSPDGEDTFGLNLSEFRQLIAENKQDVIAARLHKLNVLLRDLVEMRARGGIVMSSERLQLIRDELQSQDVIEVMLQGVQLALGELSQVMDELRNVALTPDLQRQVDYLDRAAKDSESFQKYKQEAESKLQKRMFVVRAVRVIFQTGVIAGLRALQDVEVQGSSDPSIEDPTEMSRAEAATLRSEARQLTLQAQDPNSGVSAAEAAQARLAARNASLEIGDTLPANYFDLDVSQMGSTQDLVEEARRLTALAEDPNSGVTALEAAQARTAAAQAAIDEGLGRPDFSYTGLEAANWRLALRSDQQ